MPYYDGPGFGWWGGIAQLLVMVLFWGAIVWGLVALFRWGGPRSGAGTRPGPGGPRPRDPEDPEQILARRYAAGEIDEDEFHRRLDHLRSRDPEREEKGVWRP